jgi:hypothetical protein
MSNYLYRIEYVVESSTSKIIHTYHEDHPDDFDVKNIICQLENLTENAPINFKYYLVQDYTKKILWKA